MTEEKESLNNILEDMGVSLNTYPDWGYVRSIFKNEKQYIVDLIQEIESEIQSLPETIIDFGTSAKIEVFVSRLIDADEPNREPEFAIEHVKRSFLQFLGLNETIRGLSFILKETSFGNGDDYPYWAATFTITEPLSFTKRAQSVIDLYLKQADVLAKKRYAGALVVGGGVAWSGKKIFDGARAAMFQILYDNRSVWENGAEVRKGNPVHRSELEIAGSYNSEDTFREALKKMRQIMRAEGMTYFVEIANHHKNHYFMIIRDVE